MNYSFSFFFSLLLSTGMIHTKAQPSFIEPYRITVSSNKTTHLVFPFPIKSIDRGSPDILAQKSPGTDVVLQLKAAHPRTAQTNLTVITVNNRLYSFLVAYDSMPLHLTLAFDSGTKGYKNLVAFDKVPGFSDAAAEAPRDTFLKSNSEEIERKKRKLLHLHSSHDRMQIQLEGIYAREDNYYFLFRLQNRSNVPYAAESITLTVRDAKRIKRMASQERSVPVLYQYGTDKGVPGPGKSSWVIVTSRFTLEDGKHLEIQILEKEGGRNLAFKLGNRQLLSAKKL